MRTMYKASLRRKMITSVSATVMAALTATATAQEAEEVTDEVVVTGIRQALESSLDVKRNAKGIVDSISAEDMGKFPDSNLAESLQRVTGVAIDRDQTSGEGKTVTVRGFGSDYNLVTLNGRIMPTSTLGNFAGAPSTRSYDFGNLAPEAVSRVDIYKSSQAKTASGGMGATIDIQTTRPLDNPGLNASVGLKTIEDKSTKKSRNSEESLIIHNTWMDDRLGVALSAVRQNLDHTVASWRGGFSAFEDISDGTLNANDEAGDQINGVGAQGGATGIPAGTLIANPFQGSGYYIDDLAQERENAQLTVQFRPADNITLTFDQTYSELSHEVRSRDNSVYLSEGQGGFGGNSSATYGSGNPASIEEYVFQATQDWANSGTGVPDVFANNGSVSYQNNSTEVETTGFNVEWDVNNRLNLVFDVYGGTSESLPLSDYGSLATIVTKSKVNDTVTIDYTGEMPIFNMSGELGGGANNPGTVYYNAAPNAEMAAWQEPGDTFFPGHRYLGETNNKYAYSKNEIFQYSLDGSYDLLGTEFEEYVDILEFGVSYLVNDVKSGSKDVNTSNGDGIIPLNWNNNFANYAGNLGLGQYFRFNKEPLRPYFSGIEGSDQIPMSIVSAPYEQLFTILEGHAQQWNAVGTPICTTGTLQGCLDAPYTTMQNLEEDTVSMYVQASKDFEILDRDASIVAGLRYEKTDVTSFNFVPTYSGTTVSGNDKVVANASGISEFAKTEGDYDFVLPSIDFSIELRDDVKLRAAYSQTIARQTYDKLAGGVTITKDISNTKQAFGVTGNGSEGNPALEPFEADNFDLSTEWYYGDLSYLSVGYFSKEARNWVGTANRYENVQGLRHAAYDSAGNLNGAADGTVSNSSNELVTFNVSYNSESAREETIDGIELAIQHDFSDYNPLPIDLTGLGFIFNATFVDSDADYRNQLANSENNGQFAVTGISDSYNAIAYYERFGFSTRVAYNWRDAHLVYMGASSAYTAAYEQVDVNVSYAIPGTDLTLTYDGINLNDEGRQVYERDNPSYKTWVSPGHAKHYFGVRYNY